MDEITVLAAKSSKSHHPLEVWIAKTTTATQLDVAVKKQEEKPWDMIVPKWYHKFGNIFQEIPLKCFPGKRPWHHTIDLLPNALKSMDCRVYPLSPREKEAAQKFIWENLWLKWIQWFKSLYASGFFLVSKKDGKFQPTQDYWNLNKWTILNKYPLSLISNLIHSLSNKALFTKFDIWWGYNNVHIKEGDEWKATFKTSEGLFKPTVMFFDLTISPATF